MSAVEQIRRTQTPLGLRDSHRLKAELERLWSANFADIPKVNNIDVHFAAAWKNRLGVISLSEDEQTTYIGINSLLRLPEAPIFLLQITLAHELVHYTHGFGSPLPRRYRYPHRGGVVEKELRCRGLSDLHWIYQQWIHENWFDFYDQVGINFEVVPMTRHSGNPKETYQSSESEEGRPDQDQ